jgi:hypothetical protein
MPTPVPPTTIKSNSTSVATSQCHFVPVTHRHRRPICLASHRYAKSDPRLANYCLLHRIAIQIAGLGLAAWIGIGVGALCCFIITVVLLVFCLLSRRDKANLEAYRAMAQQQQNTATPARPPEPYSIQNTSNAPFLDPSRSNTVASEHAPLMYNSGATSSFRSADMESQRQPYGFIPTESVRSGLVKTYGQAKLAVAVW